MINHGTHTEVLSDEEARVNQDICSVLLIIQCFNARFAFIPLPRPPACPYNLGRRSIMDASKPLMIPPHAALQAREFPPPPYSCCS